MKLLEWVGTLNRVQDKIKLKLFLEIQIHLRGSNIYN